MLDPDDIKLVKSYYLLPKASWSALVALFPTGALAILLIMIDNIALGSSGIGDVQLAVMIALMVLEGAVAIACGLRARFGIRSERWLRIEREAVGSNADTGVNPAVASGVGISAAGRLVQDLGGDDLDDLGQGLELVGGAVTAYGFFETMQRISEAAREVADAHGIELPRPGKTIALVICVPLLVLALSFIPRFIDSARKMSAAQRISAHVMEVYEAALAPTSSYTMADDPLEFRQDSGYRVSGNITDANDDLVASVSVETDEFGLVEGVVYNADVDTALTPEENLARAQDWFDSFHAAIAGIDVGAEGIDLADPGLLRAPTLPAEFRDAFLAGDYYTEVDVDIARTDTLRAWVVFSTDPQDEFDEYSRPQISMLVLAQ